MANCMAKISAIIATSSILLAGCAGHNSPYAYPSPGVASANITYIQKAPPPSRYVIIPRRPTASAVWIDGYWDWKGAQFSWTDGYWNTNPPRAGAQWAPSRWKKTKRGWYRQPGRWR